MAPIIRQDTAQVIDDVLSYQDDFGQIISFDEISNLANQPFDNTKLMADNVDFTQPPAVEVQPAIPLDALINETYYSSDSQPPSPEFVPMTSLTVPYPEPSHSQVQPVSPLSQELIDVGDLPTSAELMVMQPLCPAEQYSIQVQPASPQQMDQSQECSRLGVDSYLELPQEYSSIGADSFLVSPSDMIKQQAYSPVSQQLDLSQEYLSLDDLVPSPADSFVPSPSPVIKVEPSVAPQQQEQPANAPKKRGRKRKYPEGSSPRSRRTRKQKAYEMAPLDDEQAEKKRKNAINAKRHRDMQKQEKEKLAVALGETTAERDRLVGVVNQYKQREQQLLQLLNSHGIKIIGLESL